VAYIHAENADWQRAFRLAFTLAHDQQTHKTPSSSGHERSRLPVFLTLLRHDLQMIALLMPGAANQVMYWESDHFETVILSGAFIGHKLHELVLLLSVNVRHQQHQLFESYLTEILMCTK
jgi:hypothetical protein